MAKKSLSKKSPKARQKASGIESVKPPTRAAALRKKAKGAWKNPPEETAGETIGTQDGIIRDRIKELRRVPASQIVGAPWNWRTHDQEQADAVAGSLVELGIFSPLDTRELPDGTLQLIDGHLRQDLINARVGPETLIPCSVCDLSESEARKANLIKDPLSAMAGVDKQKLDDLLRETNTGSEALAKLFDELAKANAIVPPEESGGGLPPADRYTVVVECESAAQQTELLEQFQRDGLNCRAVIS
jgi:hypothetical protein